MESSLSGLSNSLKVAREEDVHLSTFDISMIAMMFSYIMIERQMEVRVKELEDRLGEMKSINDAMLKMRSLLHDFDTFLLLTTGENDIYGNNSTVSGQFSVQTGRGHADTLTIKYEIRDGKIKLEAEGVADTGDQTKKTILGDQKTGARDLDEVSFKAEYDLEDFRNFGDVFDKFLKDWESSDDTLEDAKQFATSDDLLEAFEVDLASEAEFHVTDPELNKIISEAMGDSYEPGKSYNQEFWQEVVIPAMDGHMRALGKENEITTMKLQQMIKYLNLITDLLSQQIQSEYETVKNVGSNF